MSLSKEEMIQSIHKRYRVLFSTDTKEKDIINAFTGKYHKVEVINIAKRGNADKFDRADLKSVSVNDLRRLAVKYSKRTLPPEISRNLIIDILLGKLKVDKLSDEELRLFGKKGRSTLVRSIDMYGGWIPKVKEKLDKKDLKRGKKEVGKYN